MEQFFFLIKKVKEICARYTLCTSPDLPPLSTWLFAPGQVLPGPLTSCVHSALRGNGRKGGERGENIYPLSSQGSLHSIRWVLLSLSPGFLRGQSDRCSAIASPSFSSISCRICRTHLPNLYLLHL